MGLFDFFKKDSKKSSPSSVYEQRDALEPYKVAVASPLSKFLSSRVGQGIGEFPMDSNYVNRYNDYLSVDPTKYFEDNIAAPAMKLYKEDALPVIREGFAGNLRGSGRFGAEESGLNRFTLGLAQTGAEFVPSFAASQLDAGQRMFETQYKNWYNSLPETNPVLANAVGFLGTSSTRTLYQQFADPSVGGSGLLDMISGYGFQQLTSGFENMGSAGGYSKDFYKDPKFYIDAAMLVAQAFCWVAAEVFDGWDDERTHDARYFIIMLAPDWFTNAYAKHGESVARFIHNKPILKAIIRPFFSAFALIGKLHRSKSWQITM